VCVYHCAQLSYTTQHKTVLIIFPLILQTTINGQMPVYWRGGVSWKSVIKSKVFASPQAILSFIEPVCITACTIYQRTWPTAALSDSGIKLTRCEVQLIKTDQFKLNPKSGMFAENDNGVIGSSLMADSQPSWLALARGWTTTWCWVCIHHVNRLTISIDLPFASLLSMPSLPAS